MFSTIFFFTTYFIVLYCVVYIIEQSLHDINKIYTYKTMLKNKENLPHEAKGDRFIPNEVHPCAFQVPIKPTHCSNYEEFLGKSMLSEIDANSNHRIMNFGCKLSKENQHQNTMGMGKDVGGRLKGNGGTTTEKKVRNISKKPYKVLDAPNLLDDFYLNLLSWSDKNQIAVALDTTLYLWSGCSTEITRIYQTRQISDYICSVSFCDDNKIALGNSLGQIKIFDICKKKKVNSFDGHCGRVGSLDFSHGLLASGSRDGTVASWDLRDGIVNKYKAHSQQICGLKWSPQGNYIASGGNDNKLVVYSNKNNAQLVKFHQHKAAVKAIGWCPSNPSTLASGGGTADRHIRFFSTQTLTQNYAIDTGSQICNLVFSKISNQMITTHGYSLNQINLWQTTSNWEERSVQKVTTLTGHTYRVLYLAMSPSGQSILTGAGDESLRFWNVFDSSQYKRNEGLTFSMDLR